jgi:hypothetical protein
MNAGADAVVGRPPDGAWDGLAAAPQLLLIEAFTAEADVIWTAMPLLIDVSKAPALADVERRLLELAAKVGADSHISRATVTVASAVPLRSKFALDRGHGLYLFVNAGRVIYLGRAIGPTLGERVRSQVRSRNDPVWDSVLDDAGTAIHLWQFSHGQALWAAAFEAFLNHEFHFPVNKRVS